MPGQPVSGFTRCTHRGLGLNTETTQVLTLSLVAPSSSPNDSRLFPRFLLRSPRRSPTSYPNRTPHANATSHPPSSSNTIRFTSQAGPVSIHLQFLSLLLSKRFTFTHEHVLYCSRTLNLYYKQGLLLRRNNRLPAKAWARTETKDLELLSSSG